MERIYILVVVEKEEGEDVTLDEFHDVEDIEVAHLTYEGAHNAALALIQENFTTFNDPYDQVEGNDKYVILWRNRNGDFIGILERVLKP